MSEERGDRDYDRDDRQKDRRDDRDRDDAGNEEPDRYVWS
jgi:hypothetical protein